MRWPRACIARPILYAIPELVEGLRLTSEAKAKGAPLKTGTDFDVIALLEDVPLRQADDETSICLPNVAETCAGYWGLCQDVSNNLAAVLVRVDDHDPDEEAAAHVYGRYAALREAIEAEAKPVGWRLRARDGKRIRLAPRDRGHAGHRRHQPRVGLAAGPRLTACGPRRPVAGRTGGSRTREGRQRMVYVLIEHKVGDYETFKEVYVDDAERRQRLGSLGGHVYRASDDPGNVVIVLEWDTVENAREFAGSLELEQAMEWSTSNVATPRVTVLEQAMDSPS